MMNVPTRRAAAKAVKIAAKIPTCNCVAAKTAAAATPTAYGHRRRFKPHTRQTVLFEEPRRVHFAKLSFHPIFFIILGGQRGLTLGWWRRSFFVGSYQRGHKWRVEFSSSPRWASTPNCGNYKSMANVSAWQHLTEGCLEECWAKIPAFQTFGLGLCSCAFEHCHFVGQKV
jgi:hypothetical protein